MAYHAKVDPKKLGLAVATQLAIAPGLASIALVAWA
jgi:hypothetical protein